MEYGTVSYIFPYPTLYTVLLALHSPYQFLN